MPVREPIVLIEDIKQLKRETDTAIFAHNYMDPDIIEVADYCGDSLGMALAAEQAKQKNILICSVRYTAETAAVMAPDKNIRLSHSQAICPVTGQMSAVRVRKYREDNPDVCIMASINSSLEIKAEADICADAENILRVASSVKKDKILFLPDESLGNYLKENMPEKEIEVWPGGCPVLRSVDISDIELARQKWPGVPVVVNNACRSEVRKLADFCASTGEIVEYCNKSLHEVIICDEISIHGRLYRKYPERFFRQLAPSKLICNSMRLTTLEVVERALKGEAGEQIILPFDLAESARAPLEAMIKAVSRKRKTK
ncbi:MAG: quinolinate synthase NadA [Clostridia bacterium]|nr:quinolinate synthase NadA [Clostridia bacterium]